MTSTHPVPEVLCSVSVKVLNQDQILFSSKRNYYLIILLNNSTHYLNKNAIRGGRGAIGRIPNIAVVIGNETDGVRKEILEKCNEYAKISMAPGQSSLYIAVSAALFTYEYTRLFVNLKG